MGLSERENKEALDVLLNEKKRWARMPWWGIALAMLQLVGGLLGMPWALRQVWEPIQSMGHPFYVNFFLLLAVHITVMVLMNLSMLLVYKAKHPFFEQYRSEPNSPFPWEETPNKWPSLLRRNVMFLLFNVFVFVPMIGVVLSPDIGDLTYRYDLESWPSLWEMAWQVIFCSFCEDFLFYCTHRLLHTSWCYRHIHKRHHEYRQPVTLGAEFAHPVEIFFGFMLPFQIGSIILGTRMHSVTLCLWGVYRIVEGGEAHCGYDFPWSPFRLLPFSGRPLSHSPRLVPQLPPHPQFGQLRDLLLHLGHCVRHQQELLSS